MKYKDNWGIKLGKFQNKSRNLKNTNWPHPASAKAKHGLRCACSGTGAMAVQMAKPLQQSR